MLQTFLGNTRRVEKLIKDNNLQMSEYVSHQRTLTIKNIEILLEGNFKYLLELRDEGKSDFQWNPENEFISYKIRILRIFK